METQPHVLVVSRVATEREKIADLVAESKAQLVFAETAADAIDLIFPRCSFDVVFLAVDSPQEGHDHFLRAIQQSDPTTAVVLISPVDDVAFYLDCLGNGAFDYLPRPIDWKEFRRIFQLALHHRMQAQGSRFQAA